MQIGVDIMGGDFAPEETIKGAILAAEILPQDVKLIMFGNESTIIRLLKKKNLDPDKYDIVHTSEVIEMGDHPAKTYSSRPDSSIARGFEFLQKGKIDGFAGAGNTGAMLVGSMYTIKSVPGVIRPTIPAIIPKVDGQGTILLDVGINPDCRPDVLYQYAILGSLYAESVNNLKAPRVGLLNIGSEEEKGNLLTKSTYELMKGSRDFNFIGNVEGNEIFFQDKADVIVCDGFVGNVVIKQIEAFYSLVKKRNIKDSYFEQFNFEIHGGTPVLGVNSNVIIGHGISNAVAIKNMILHTKEIIQANLSVKILKAFQ